MENKIAPTSLQKENTNKIAPENLKDAKVKKQGVFVKNIKSFVKSIKTGTSPIFPHLQKNKDNKISRKKEYTLYPAVVVDEEGRSFAGINALIAEQQCRDLNFRKTNGLYKVTTQRGNNDKEGIKIATVNPSHTQENDYKYFEWTSEKIDWKSRKEAQKILNETSSYINNYDGNSQNIQNKQDAFIRDVKNMEQEDESNFRAYTTNRKPTSQDFDVLHKNNPIHSFYATEPDIDPARYVALYMVAAKTGSAFVTNAETVLNVKKRLSQTFENAVNAGDYGKVYDFGNTVDKTANNVVKEQINKEQNRNQTQTKQQDSFIKKAAKATTFAKMAGFEL